MTFDLNKYFSEKKSLIDKELPRWIPDKTVDPTVLHEAMHYSLFAPGKRIRPMLAFASAAALELTDDDVLPIAAAIEMIHVFSLIHDDLPAMDDDDLRRGQPTNHKVFGEAVAILAGDNLLAHAFVPLADLDAQKFDARHILAVIKKFAELTGSYGMIAGQVIDMQSEGKKIDLERLQKLHRYKTGALIRLAVIAPAILCGAEKTKLHSLALYADQIGLAFQIADDILDVTGDATLGKDIGSDAENNKATYVTLLGLDQAKIEAKKALTNALTALDNFGEKATALRHLAEFIVSRKN